MSNWLPLDNLTVAYLVKKSPNSMEPDVSLPYLPQNNLLLDPVLSQLNPDRNATVYIFNMNLISPSQVQISVLNDFLSLDWPTLYP
jgi:hypothetical protein